MTVTDIDIVGQLHGSEAAHSCHVTAIVEAADAISDEMPSGASGMLGHETPQVAGGRWQFLSMKKTSIYLDPEIDRALGRRAASEGTTKAALIRHALADAAAPALRSKPRACGVFSGLGDLSENVDRYLADTGFGET